PLVVARAEDRFLDRLAGERDPERKRRIIGHTFIEVFEEQARQLAEDGRGPVELLVQGTLYPDVIESVSVRGPSATIKTHHNVGVMGDERTYENAIAVRCVTSVDAMTADWAPLPTEVLQAIGTRIINEVKGVNRVVYDISSKPPATIEWE